MNTSLAKFDEGGTILREVYSYFFYFIVDNKGYFREF